MCALPATPEAFIDLYRRGHFVFESKQFAARREELSALEAAAVQAGAIAADLSKHFTSTKPAALQEILESLAALGRARVDEERFAV